LFADDDTSFDFPFDVTITTYNHDGDYDASNNKKIIRIKRLYLSGYKLDSDETAQSTGVTLWNASPRLAKYIQLSEFESESDNSNIIQSQGQSQDQSNNEHMNMKVKV